MLFIRTSEKEDLLFNLYRVTDLKVENPGTILQWCKFASVQFSSVTQSYPTLYDPMDCTTQGLPVHHSQNLLKLMSIESVMPSNHLIFCDPLHLLPSIFPSIRVFSSESVLHIKYQTKVQELLLQSLQCIFRTDFLQDGLVNSPCSPRDSQESSPTPQFKGINSSAFSFLYDPTLTSIHDYWKNQRFAIWIFVSKVMSLLFNMLPRFLIAFLQRANVLISWCI